MGSQPLNRLRGWNLNVEEQYRKQGEAAKRMEETPVIRQLCRRGATTVTQVLLSSRHCLFRHFVYMKKALIFFIYFPSL